MAINWNPKIEYDICIKCGMCIENCKHDVYDKEKYPVPEVKNKLNCIDHCHGCGNVCPVGAITYVGEDTDWVPKNKN